MMFDLESSIPEYICAYGYAIEIRKKIDDSIFLKCDKPLKEKYSLLLKYLLGGNIYKIIQESFANATKSSIESKFNEKDVFSDYKVCSCFSPYAVVLEYREAVVIFLPLESSIFTYRDLFNAYFDKDRKNNDKEYILFSVDQHNVDALNFDFKYIFSCSYPKNIILKNCNELSFILALQEFNRHIPKEQKELLDDTVYNNKFLDYIEVENNRNLSNNELKVRKKSK